MFPKWNCSLQRPTPLLPWLKRCVTIIFYGLCLNLDSPNSPVLFSSVPFRIYKNKEVNSEIEGHLWSILHILYMEPLYILRQWSSCLTLFIHGPIMIDVVYPWINHLCHCLFMDQSQLTLFIHGPIIFYTVPSWINCLLESAWTLISLLHYTLVGLLKKRGSNVFSHFLLSLPPPHLSPPL